jgi:predicted transcriptional regulator
MVAKTLLVHVYADYLRISQEETVRVIPTPVHDKDFCGQVIYYDEEDNPVKEFNHPL